MEALRGLDLKERGTIRDVVHELARGITLQYRVGRGDRGCASLVVFESLDDVFYDLRRD